MTAPTSTPRVLPRWLMIAWLCLAWTTALFASAPTPSSNTAASGNLDATAVVAEQPEIRVVEDLSSFPKAKTISVEGTVRGLLFTTLKRRTEEAIASGCNLIIYRLNSPGGELGAAMDMANYVYGLDSEIHTIAFIEEQAYSAAALFSLACDDMAMAPGSAVGDCEPILMTQGGYTTAGEKIQSPLKQRFREFATGNGYPSLLAQAMVTSQLKIYSLRSRETGELSYMRSEDYDILTEEQKATFKDLRIVCHEGDLLTLGSAEALELGFSMGTYDSAEAMVEALGYEELVVEVELNQAEMVVSSLDAYSGLLLALGLFLLYMEFKTPGVGVFGALGAVCFAAFFVSRFYEGQANYLEVSFFILGIALLMLELLVFPGFGVAGFAGLMLMLASLVLSMQDFTIPEGELQMETFINNLATVSYAFIGATLLMAVTLFIRPKKSPTEKDPCMIHTTTEDTSFPPKPGESSSLVGKEGLTTTPLMPGGKASIEGEICQVAAESGWCDANIEIVVVDQQGPAITVRPLNKPSPSPS